MIHKSIYSFQSIFVQRNREKVVKAFFFQTIDVRLWSSQGFPETLMYQLLFKVFFLVSIFNLKWRKQTVRHKKILVNLINMPWSYLIFVIVLKLVLPSNQFFGIPLYIFYSFKCLTIVRTLDNYNEWVCGSLYGAASFAEHFQLLIKSFIKW